MVVLKFYNSEDFLGLQYILSEEQLQFTATPQQALSKIKERNTGLMHPISVYQDHNLAGFFVLDFGEDKLEMTQNVDAVLLRSFSIHPELQGKGIGKYAMQIVDIFLHENFSHCNEIVLAVNNNNYAAKKLYETSGYLYNGKTKIGRSGLQLFMSKKI